MKLIKAVETIEAALQWACCVSVPPSPHPGGHISPGFPSPVSSGLGVSEDMSVWLGSLPAAPPHLLAAQLC